MEAAFCAHHAYEPGQLSRSRGVIATFKAMLPNKFPRVPEAIHGSFATTRTFIRLRKVNKHLQAEPLARRESRKRKAHS